MKRIVFTLPGVLLFFILSGCNNLGKERTFNGVELYHTESISDTLAGSLGKYLIDAKFANGNDKAVQITKIGDTYHFRMVIKDSLAKDTSFDKSFRLFAANLSSGVFNGAPVVLETCDDQMNTLKSYAAEDLGKVTKVNGVELYQSKDVTEAEADSLGKYLLRTKFADGTPKTIQLAKSGSTYQFRMVIKKEFFKDADYQKNAKAYAADISAAVFRGAPVELDLCDDNFDTVVALPMDAGAKKM